MRLLAREGVRVVYPQDQTCCGQPVYNSGFWEEARAVAAAQLHAFPTDIPVVIPSASCAGMFRVHYPRLFAVTGIEKVIARLDQLPPLLTLLTRSATGQAITTYVNAAGGVRGLFDLS